MPLFFVNQTIPYMNRFFTFLVLFLSLTLCVSSCQKNDPTPLSVPSVTADASSHSLTVCWTPVSGASSYIYRFAGSEGVMTSATSVIFEGLTSETDYTFYIKSVSGSGDYTNSSEQAYTFTTSAEVFSMSAEVTSSSFSAIDVRYKADGDADHVRWYLGSELSYNADAQAFAEGAKTGTLSVDNTSFIVDKKSGLQAGQPAVIFMQVVSIDGKTGPVIELKANAAPVSFTPSKVSLGSFVATVDKCQSEDYIGMGFLAMTTDTPDDWGMTAEEIVSMYAEYYMIDVTAPGESVMVELNGDPEVPHYVGLVYWGADYSPKDIKILEYTSGKVISDASAATIDVTVTNIGQNTADLVFAPGDATCGYFYRLYAKADYEEALEDGKSFGYENPVEYVRELVAAGGSMDYKAQTDSRSYLKVATDYVLATFPYNVNGSKGWGESSIVSFTTAGAAGAPSASPASEQPSSKRPEIRKLLK